MNFTLFIKLIVCFGVLELQNVKGKCENLITSATWKFKAGRDVSHFGVETVEECASLCASNPECRGYTWRFDDVIGWCYKFAVLENIHECAGCQSGTVAEVLEGSCLAGADDIIDEVTVESSEACAQLCTTTDGCLGYTWYEKTTPFPQFCFMYKNCEDTVPCYGCSSGRLSCISSPQCYGYRVLDEESRSVNLHSEQNSNFDFCDREASGDDTSLRWRGPGYYRIKEPAGTQIPTSNPGPDHCGTYRSSWINGDTDSIQVGEERTMEACFSTNGVSCYHTMQEWMLNIRGYYDWGKFVDNLLSWNSFIDESINEYQ